MDGFNNDRQCSRGQEIGLIGTTENCDLECEKSEWKGSGTDYSTLYNKYFV